MTREIDCRGLACPMPALKTKKALDAIESGRILAIVDNHAARENVIRLAAFLGCEVSSEEKGDVFYMTIIKPKT
jgi:TusA-related sulfurtransferase